MIFQKKLPLLVLQARDPASEALDSMRGHCRACQVVNFAFWQFCQAQSAYTRRIVMFAIQFSWRISVSIMGSGAHIFVCL